MTKTKSFFSRPSGAKRVIPSSMLPASMLKSEEKDAGDTPGNMAIVDEVRRAALLQEVDNVRAKLRLRAGDNYIVNPSRKWVRYWDGVTFGALIFTAIVTPVEVAFFGDPQIDALWWINRLVDLVFLSDMGLQFFLAYHDHTKGGLLVTRRKLIWRKYLRSWFGVDFMSSIPFDVISTLSDSAVLSRFKPMRLLRLLKLARVTRAKRILARWEAYAAFAVSYSTLTVYKLCALVALFAHWSACVWGLAAHPMLIGEDRWSWIHARKQLMQNENGNFFKIGNVSHKYAAALYFAIYTLTGIGYGDVVAETHWECVVIICIIICSAVFWAYIIGSFCNVVSSMNAEETTYRQRMDQLNAMMAERTFPTELRQRCRMYLVHSKDHLRLDGYQQLENLFSVDLRGDVAYGINSAWLTKVWYLSGASKNFVVELSQATTTVMYAPMETLDIVHALMILQAGIAARKGRVLSKGALWGLDFIMENSEHIDRTCAAALSYVSVCCLARDDFFAILSDEKLDDERKEVARASRHYRFRFLLERFGHRHALSSGKKSSVSSINICRQGRRTLLSARGDSTMAMMGHPSMLGRGGASPERPSFDHLRRGNFINTSAPITDHPSFDHLRRRSTSIEPDAREAELQALHESMRQMQLHIDSLGEPSIGTRPLPPQPSVSSSSLMRAGRLVSAMPVQVEDQEAESSRSISSARIIRSNQTEQSFRDQQQKLQQSAPSVIDDVGEEYVDNNKKQSATRLSTMTTDNLEEVQRRVSALTVGSNDSDEEEAPRIPQRGPPASLKRGSSCPRQIHEESDEDDSAPPRRQSMAEMGESMERLENMVGALTQQLQQQGTIHHPGHHTRLEDFKRQVSASKFLDTERGSQLTFSRATSFVGPRSSGASEFSEAASAAISTSQRLASSASRRFIATRDVNVAAAEEAVAVAPTYRGSS